jgi:hypothetical protein
MPLLQGQPPGLSPHHGLRLPHHDRVRGSGLRSDQHEAGVVCVSGSGNLRRELESLRELDGRCDGRAGDKDRPVSFPLLLFSAFLLPLCLSVIVRSAVSLSRHGDRYASLLLSSLTLKSQHTISPAPSSEDQRHSSKQLSSPPSTTNQRFALSLSLSVSPCLSLTHTLSISIRSLFLSLID